MDHYQIAGWSVQIEESLDALEKNLSVLCQLIHADNDLPSWVYDPAQQSRLEDEIARSKICAVLSSLEFENDQDTRETITLPGMLGSSPETLQQVNLVNHSKDVFSLLLKELQGETVIVEACDNAERRIEKRVPVVKYVLKKMGRGRLNVIQARRQIKSFVERPSYVGFIWASTNKVKKMTKSQVSRLLYNLGEDDNVYAALDILNTIPEHETLAYIRPPHIHVRINLRWNDPTSDLQCYPGQINSSLPLFVPCKSNQPLPYHRSLDKPKERKPRKKRLNQKYEDSPIFDIAKIYRYLPEYR